ncbi:hypothetical protein IGI04_023265 [Brassica rapa subsp. trilocularis]|uniref:Uncharacterized protein n=1 Tax=Brassica rapa subsp. trilocularis TaxID=1813537 RepID=A0ABQ7M3B9_BRACM|nr:hypothetical protein IGI04_023265 [Brassica rapa subsp. trilocularis]
MFKEIRGRLDSFRVRNITFLLQSLERKKKNAGCVGRLLFKFTTFSARLLEDLRMTSGRLMEDFWKTYGRL